MTKKELIKNTPTWALKAFNPNFADTIQFDAGKISEALYCNPFMNKTKETLEQIQDSAKVVDRLYPDHKVRIVTSFGELTHDFGEFVFEIYSTVLILKLEGFTRQSSPHPHISSEGIVCLGDSGRWHWRRLIEKGQFIEALIMALEILKTYNPNSPYRHFITYLISDQQVCEICHNYVSEEVTQYPREYWQGVHEHRVCSVCGKTVCDQCGKVCGDGIVICRHCMLKCYQCGDIISPQQAVITRPNPHILCPNCDKIMAKCASCGHSIVKSDWHKCVSCGRLFCRHCINLTTLQCHECVPSGLPAGRECAHCGKELSRQDLIQCPTCEQWVCEDCYHPRQDNCEACNNREVCERCDDVLEEGEDLYFCRTCGRHVCNSCWFPEYGCCISCVPAESDEDEREEDEES